MNFARIARAIVAAGIFAAASPVLAQAPAPAAPAAPAAAAPMAVTASHAKAARDLAVVMGLELPIVEILNETRSQLLRTYTTTRPEIAKDMEAVLNALVPEVAKEKEDVIAKAVQIVSAEFTEPELGELNKFFASPVGTKYLKEQPAIFQKYFLQVQTWQRALGDKIIARVREEMKKKGHTL